MGCPPTGFYRPELDALRFLAFSLAFLFHTATSITGQMYAAGIITAFVALVSKGGSYGVDLFFLLSAYLITELLMREKARNGSIITPDFYASRQPGALLNAGRKSEEQRHGRGLRQNLQARLRPGQSSPGCFPVGLSLTPGAHPF
jgi:hypothetical protein